MGTVPGLSNAQATAYLAALNDSATRTSARVQVLNLDHKFLGEFGDHLTDAQASFNRGAEVDRSASLTFVDLADTLAELDLRHLVRVEHGVEVDGDMIWVPVITGRVMAGTDDGDTSSVEIHGKESFGLLPGAPANPRPKGQSVAGVIRDMFEEIGESKFRIARSLLNGGPKLTNAIHTGGPDPDKAPMMVARRLCRKRDLQVFFDAEGYLVVRRPPTEPLVTWADDEDSPELGSAQTSPIRWTRDLRNIRNTIVARGKGDVRVTVDADDLYKGHVYSPSSLRRGGVPGRLKHYWRDEAITRERALRQGAESVLRKLLVERSQASLSCVPTFHAGPHDLGRAVRRDGRWADFYINEASIPILGDGDMTVGYQQAQRGRRGRRARAL